MFVVFDVHFLAPCKNTLDTRREKNSSLLYARTVEKKNNDAHNPYTHAINQHG